MLEHALLAGFAGWRLAMMFVNEAGPGDIFGRIRSLAGVPDEGIQEPRPFIGGLLSCPYCTSVWTAAGFYALGGLVSWQAVGVAAATGVAATLLDVGSRVQMRA